MLTEEPLKWPGTSKVVQSYLTYHKGELNGLLWVKPTEL